MVVDDEVTGASEVADTEPEKVVGVVGPDEVAELVGVLVDVVAEVDDVGGRLDDVDDELLGCVCPVLLLEVLLLEMLLLEVLLLEAPPVVDDGDEGDEEDHVGELKLPEFSPDEV